MSKGSVRRPGAIDQARWNAAFSKSNPCGGCDGTGRVPADGGEVQCPECGGSCVSKGLVPADDGPTEENTGNVAEKKQ